MNACIFAGPTLPPRDEARTRTAIWLPPAKQGDVYRAVLLLRPRAIGIVDGYFQWVPSVWHKEILWALQQGVHVFGSASMGALRAAELAPFGMQGVGIIYDAYRKGRLAQCADEPFEDDDEVAVIHGPAESGYLALSEAMVNIRCTLANAQRAGVISPATRTRLVAIAKALFFPQRSYGSLLQQGREEALPNAELSALDDWLPSGRMDQKREDALAMLAEMENFLAQQPAPHKPRFAFESTTLWERAASEALPGTIHDTCDAGVLDELRLAGERWVVLRRQALRALLGPAMSAESPSAGIGDSIAPLVEIDRRLDEAAKLEVARRVLAEVPAAIVERQMLRDLRDAGEFDRLRARAADKSDRVSAQGRLPDASQFSDLQLLQLRDWYFSRVLEQEMPDDIGQSASAFGYANLAHFHQALFTEYVYRQTTGTEAQERAGAGR